LRDEQHEREHDAQRIVNTIRPPTTTTPRASGEKFVSISIGVIVLTTVTYAVVCAALGFVIGELAR